MHKLSLLFFCLSTLLLFGQPPRVDPQQPLPLRLQVKENPMARKAYKAAQFKMIGGALVGTSGVILLYHSLGTLSPRQHHKWEQTLLATGLIGTGLWITKGYKSKRKKAEEWVKKRKNVHVALTPSSLYLKLQI